MAIQYSETEYRNFGKCICLENGKIRLIYIKEEINGFGIHLTSQK